VTVEHRLGGPRLRLARAAEMKDETVTLNRTPIACSPNTAVTPIPLMSTRMTSASESRKRSWTGLQSAGIDVVSR